MRLVEALQIAAGLIGALASALMAVEQRLIKRLRRAGATTQKAAVALPSRSPLTRWRVARLKSFGAIVVGAEGRLHLDEAAYRILRKRRAVLAICTVLSALFVVVIVHTALR